MAMSANPWVSTGPLPGTKCVSLLPTRGLITVSDVSFRVSTRLPLPTRLRSPLTANRPPHPATVVRLLQGDSHELRTIFIGKEELSTPAVVYVFRWFKWTYVVLYCYFVTITIVHHTRLYYKRNEVAIDSVMVDQKLEPTGCPPTSR